MKASTVHLLQKINASGLNIWTERQAWAVDRRVVEVVRKRKIAV